MSGTTHIAATIEDAVMRRLVHVLRARGWRPRTIAHTGYGSPTMLRVLGRVVMTRRPLPTSDAEADTPTAPGRGWRRSEERRVGREGRAGREGAGVEEKEGRQYVSAHGTRTDI